MVLTWQLTEFEKEEVIGFELRKSVSIKAFELNRKEKPMTTDHKIAWRFWIIPLSIQHPSRGRLRVAQD
jgi:hypothetical protein